MPECATTGCSKQVRNYARCPMHRAEYLYEGVDFGEDDSEDLEDDWVVRQQGIDGDAEGQTTLDGGISKEDSR